jgi:hypothetical protein
MSPAQEQFGDRRTIGATITAKDAQRLQVARISARAADDNTDSERGMKMPMVHEISGTIMHGRCVGQPRREGSVVILWRRPVH